MLRWVPPMAVGFVKCFRVQYGTIMLTSLGWGICVDQDRVDVPVGLVPRVPRGLAFRPPQCPRAVESDRQHRVVLLNGFG